MKLGCWERLTTLSSSTLLSKATTRISSSGRRSAFKRGAKLLRRDAQASGTLISFRILRILGGDLDHPLPCVPPQLEMEKAFVR